MPVAAQIRVGLHAHGVGGARIVLWIAGCGSSWQSRSSGSLAMMTAIRKSVGSSDKQRQGWYPDPKNPAQYRYYDGNKWTEMTANGDQDPPNS